MCIYELCLSLEWFSSVIGACHMEGAMVVLAPQIRSVQPTHDYWFESQWPHYWLSFGWRTPRRREDTINWETSQILARTECTSTHSNQSFAADSPLDLKWRRRERTSKYVCCDSFARLVRGGNRNENYLFLELISLLSQGSRQTPRSSPAVLILDLMSS